MKSASHLFRAEGVLACALAGALAFSLGSGFAQAGPQGQWTRLTDWTMGNIDEVGLARTSDGVLHVVWLRKDGNLMDLMHTSMGADGHVVGSPTTVLKGWTGISNPDLIVGKDGGLRVLFGGMRTTDIKDPYSRGSLYSATAGADGMNWTLQKGAEAASGSVHASPVGAALTPDGKIVTTWTSTGALSVHFGLDPKVPDQTFQNACCAYQSGLAVDATTGEVVLGWYSNATRDQGLFTQTILPAAETKQSLPGSASPDRNSSISIDQRIGISSRLGAPGVYVAYGTGYPSFKAVYLWRHRDGQPVAVARGGNIRHVNLGPAPEGRLWIMWTDSGRLFAVRTNTAATRFGAIVAVAPPKGTISVFKVTGEGSRGPLDLFTHVDNGPNKIATWHTQVFPPLTLAASPKSFVGTQGATVHFSVLDVDDPVAGATVTVDGRSLTTDAQGHASLVLPKAAKPAILTATATKSGYTPASLRLTEK